MVAISGVPGIQTVADGASANARTDHSGAMVVQEVAPILTEAVYRGVVFSASVPPGTGVVATTAIAATGAMFTLANPATSGKNLVLWEFNYGFVSGTMSSGIIVLLAHNTATPIVAPANGTAIVPQNQLMAFGTASVANCRFNNTVPATGLVLRNLWNIGIQIPATASFAASATYPINGGVLVAPGTAVSVQAISAAVTTGLCVIGAVWLEEPV